jgi:hypothetical protein
MLKSKVLNLGSFQSPKLINELHQLISWWDIVHIYILKCLNFILFFIQKKI